jgi:hypothetical protein
MDALQCRSRFVFRLRFEPVVEGEQALDIPCDAAGVVGLDTIDEPDRNAYFYARIVHRMRFTSRVTRVDGF